MLSQTVTGINIVRIKSHALAFIIQRNRYVCSKLVENEICAIRRGADGAVARSYEISSFLLTFRLRLFS